MDTSGQLSSLKTTAWFYRGKFWIKALDSGTIHAVVLSSNKELQKYKRRVEQMRAVDEYIANFGLTSSTQIYKMLSAAVDGDSRVGTTTTNRKANVLFARKLKPRWKGRLVLLCTVARALLNTYFIISNLMTLRKVDIDWRLLVGVAVTIEALLWLVSFARMTHNLGSLFSRLCRGDTTHFQSKNVPDHLRQLGSLSVLRYLPSGESLTMLNQRGKEWVLEKRADFRFQISTSRCKSLVTIRWIILSVLDVVGPFVAVLSLYHKMAQV